jgi:uncharacterized phage protein (TIGR01671 family)
MKEIKFRAWSNNPKDMLYHGVDGVEIYVHSKSAFKGSYDYNDIVLMQYTGKKCHNNREVYECDILFYEEETTEGDVRYYLVVTWIEEWSMFATLFIEEYRTYLREGSKGLDEGMFWTYTIEECDTYHYAGNIHQNPELIQVK